MNPARGADAGTASANPREAVADLEAALKRASVNVVLTVAAFGLMPVFKKLAIEQGTPAGSVAVVTVLIAALTSVLLVVRRGPQALGCLLARRHAPSLALLGVLATGLVTLLVAHALTVTTATNRSLFQAAYPASTLLFAHLMLGERLRAAQYAGIGAMTLGLLLMNGVGAELRFGHGFWLLALTLPLIGFSDVYGKRLTVAISPPLLACGRHVYGALFLLALAPWVVAGDWPTPGNWPWLAAAGVLQGVGVWALYRALRVDKASLVASLIAASPLVTAVVEVLFLDLALHPWQWTGAAVVVLAAVWLGQRS